jgi:hypothetical protein
MLTLGVASVSAQVNVQPADSVRADTESRFGQSFLLATLGSAGGAFIGGAIGLTAAGGGEDHVGNFFLGIALGSTIGSGLGAAVGARNRGVWPYLGAAVGCVAGSLIVFNGDLGEAGVVMYFPAQGLFAGLFAQIGN